MEIAFFGLGKMGQRMVKKLVIGGHTVIAWNRTRKTADDLKNGLDSGQDRLTIASSPQEAVSLVTHSPKIIWLMLPAGQATEDMLLELMGYLQPGDIMVDGSNAKFSDTERRAQMLTEKGFKFLGIGVSGGVIAGVEGYPMMVGGDRDAYEYIRPLLDTLSQPHGGHEYFGSGGAGHFVKMVHNGIEYGMMQAIGEGFEVLEKSSYHFNLQKVAHLWQKGTIVSSFLIDRAADMLDVDPTLSEFVGPVTENGEARWTIEEGKAEGVETPIISGSLDYRLETQKDETKQQNYTTRMLNALRNAFGGHEVKK